MKTLKELIENALYESTIPTNADFYKDSVSTPRRDIRAAGINFECKDLLTPYASTLDSIAGPNKNAGEWLGIKAKIEHGQVYYFFYKNEGMDIPDCQFITCDFGTYDGNQGKAKKGVINYFKEIEKNPDIIKDLIEKATNSKSRRVSYY